MNARPDFNNPPLINQASVVHVRGTSPHWDVLKHNTHAAVISRTLAEMAAEGYEAYWPQLLKRAQPTRNGKRATKLEWVSEALFPGYIFVRRAVGLTPVRPMSRIYGIEGMSLGHARQWEIDGTTAKEREITVTRETEDGRAYTVTLKGLVNRADRRFLPGSGYQEPDEWRRSLKAGDRVQFDMFDRMLDGVVEANADGRLSLLTEFMGQASRFTVDLPVRVRAIG